MDKYIYIHAAFSIVVITTNAKQLWRLVPDQVRIERGELLSGMLTKSTMGKGQGGLVHVVWQEHGPVKARSLLNQTQTAVNHWVLNTGFSIGIGDAIADPQTMIKINETIAGAKDDVKSLIKDWQEKRLEQQPGRTMEESFENRVNQVFNNRENTCIISPPPPLPPFFFGMSTCSK